MPNVRDTGGSTFPVVAHSEGAGASGTSYAPAGLIISTGAASGKLVVMVALGNTGGNNMGTPAMSGGGLTWVPITPLADRSGAKTHMTRIWEAEFTSQLTNVQLTLSWTTSSVDFAIGVAVDCLSTYGASGGPVTGTTSSGQVLTAALTGVPAGAWSYVAVMHESGNSALTPNGATTELSDNFLTSQGTATGINTSGSGSVGLGWTQGLDFAAIAGVYIDVPSGGGGTSDNTDTATVTDTHDLRIDNAALPITEWRSVMRERFGVTDAAPNTLVGTLVREVEIQGTHRLVSDVDSASVADSSTADEVIHNFTSTNTDSASVADPSIVALKVAVTDAAATADLAAAGGTDISAGNVSGTWTAANSPYRIHGNILVLKGTTLTIDPGVKVEWQGQYNLTVRGTFHAVGTAGNHIQFTTTDADIALGASWVGWTGIRIYGGDEFDDTLIDHGAGTYNIQYCEIDYVDKRAGIAGNPYYDIRGALYVALAYDGDILLHHNLFRHHRSRALWLHHLIFANGVASQDFDDNVFEYQETVNAPLAGGAHCQHQNGSPVTLRFNGGAIRHSTISGGGSAFESYDYPSILTNVEITDCANPIFEFDTGQNGSVTWVASQTDTGTAADSSTADAGAGATNSDNTDGAAASDAAAVQLGAATSDAAAATDSGATALRTAVVDSSGAADSTSSAQVVAQVDGGTASDSSTSGVSGAGTSANADAAVVADSSLTALVAQTVDTTTAGDSSTAGVGVLSAATDSAAASDAVSARLTAAQVDAASAADSSATALGAAQGDAASVSDSSVAAVGAFSAVTDSATAADSTATSLRAATTDAATASDSNTAGTGTQSATSDSASVSDSTAAGIGTNSSTTDVSSTADSSTVTVVFWSSPVDAASVTDTALVGVVVRSTDVAAVGDAAAAEVAGAPAPDGFTTLVATGHRLTLVPDPRRLAPLAARARVITIVAKPRRLL